MAAAEATRATVKAGSKTVDKQAAVLEPTRRSSRSVAAAPVFQTHSSASQESHRVVSRGREDRSTAAKSVVGANDKTIAKKSDACVPSAQGKKTTLKPPVHESKEKDNKSSTFEPFFRFDWV